MLPSVVSSFTLVLVTEIDVTIFKQYDIVIVEAINKPPHPLFVFKLHFAKDSRQIDE